MMVLVVFWVGEGITKGPFYLFTLIELGDFCSR